MKKTTQALKKMMGRLELPAARHDNNTTSGQSLLEFALMLPFLTLLSVGIAEIGRVAFVSMVVANAATAGVEYGAQNHSSAANITGMQTAATNDANYSGMTATATYGCACDTGSGTSCTYPVPATSSCSSLSCASGQVVECVQVTTTATFSPIFHYPGLPASYTANGQAVRRVRD